jgi:uncharacterized protein (DUF2384 family)
MAEPGGEDVVGVLDALATVYTPEGVGVWLFGRHRSLDGRRPIDVLRAGDVQAVRDTVPESGMIAT